MRKTLWTLGIVAVVSAIAYFALVFISDQVILENLTGDVLVTAIQSKLNYNALSLIALALGGAATFGIAILVFCRYIMLWSWTAKIP